MTDELNPYPGNLKHHKVRPMLSDAELIAFILRKWKEELEGDGWETSENYKVAMNAAATAGHKPSEQ